LSQHQGFVLNAAKTCTIDNTAVTLIFFRWVQS